MHHTITRWSAFAHQLANTIEDHIDALLANSVVTARIVVGCIFLASNQLFRVEKLAVSASPHFI